MIGNPTSKTLLLVAVACCGLASPVARAQEQQPGTTVKQPATKRTRPGQSRLYLVQSKNLTTEPAILNPGGPVVVDDGTGWDEDDRTPVAAAMQEIFQLQLMVPVGLKDDAVAKAKAARRVQLLAPDQQLDAVLAKVDAAEANTRAEARAQAQALAGGLARAQANVQARELARALTQVEAEALAQAQAQAQARAETLARAQAQARAEALARARAQVQAQAMTLTPEQAQVQVQAVERMLIRRMAPPLNPKNVLVLDRNNIDRWVFGNMTTDEERREWLEVKQEAMIERAEASHFLTESQRGKLRLAARGDVKRLLDRVETARGEFDRARTKMTEGIQYLTRQLTPVCEEFALGPFGEGSLFDKTLTRIIQLEKPAPREAR